jgi:hypothetical protein
MLGREIARSGEDDHPEIIVRRPGGMTTPGHLRGDLEERLDRPLGRDADELERVAEAGGVLAPPGQLIHEAAGVLSRSPAHLNLERRH